MWPKVFAQLVELLPHVHRLIPVADKFMASRASNERFIEGSLADQVHGDLGQISASNAGLYRLLQNQSVLIAEVADEVRAARIAMVVSTEQVAVLEKQVAAINIWVKACAALLAIVLGMLVAMLLRAH